MIRELLGKVSAKLPTHFHYDCWVLADEVPSIVQFEGSLQLMRPIVRIELVSPRFLAMPEDKKMLSNYVRDTITRIFCYLGNLSPGTR